MINTIRYFSSTSAAPHKVDDSTSKNTAIEVVEKSDHIAEDLDPWFVTGFTDAEGSFIISIFKDDNYKFKWRISAYFSIHIQVKDALLLGLIHKTLGVGKLLLFPKGKG